MIKGLRVVASAAVAACVAVVLVAGTASARVMPMWVSVQDCVAGGGTVVFTPVGEYMCSGGIWDGQTVLG